ncbi:unnamed protein product [Parnassius apollo]|uniref:(apollo) hypothetical protein n=1 Tax=Parnassius apollo TaxID=110799 RepID=A0A8S3Y8E0_PARAO|nr:unnamed protein product [Parnassius apollo]
MHRVHLKELDLKLSSKKPNFDWPYFFDNPQKYEQFEDASEIEKAKDKRYSADFIPLHKNIPSSSSKVNRLPLQYPQDADNPVFGDQAFFSFILNDYFDRNIEDDPTLFKGLHWGKEFDSEFSTKGRDAKRIRRLENNNLNDKSFDTSVNLETYGEQKQNIGSYSKVKQHKYPETCKGFKDFVEKFAQKFGSRNNENNAKSFVSKGEGQNNEKSQKYTNPKDEFQETGELLEELLTNYNDGNVDEKDTFSTTISDFEHFLNAHESPSTNKDTDDKILLGKYAASRLSRFRYVAKNAALVNNADYIDTSEYAI